jgi:hypothetical protein
MKEKNLKYYESNAVDDYSKTPISVLRYINELEQVCSVQKKLIDLLESQVENISAMSKIELGDDVIIKYKALKSVLNEKN